MNKLSKKDVFKYATFARTLDGQENVIRVGAINYLIDQLDEPEKVVIPQFVADYITDNKEAGYTLQQVFYYIHTDYKQGEINEYVEWISTNEESFARAWLDWCEVVKEPKWVVKLGNSYLYEPMADVGSNGLIRLTRNKIEAYHFESKEMAYIHIDKFGGEEVEVSK